MVRTPLHMFDMEYDVDEYLQMVESGEYDVNARDADGKTPLHYAAEQKQIDIICSLLEHGADPNIPDIANGITPLWRAVFKVDDTGVGVEQMLAHGGDPTIANTHGKTPLDLASTIVDRPALQRLLPLLKHAADNLPPPDPDAPAPVTRRRHDGVSPITVTATEPTEQFNELWDYLVPDNTAATIKQGEVIRAAGRIQRELFTNGGANWDRDYRKMKDALLKNLASGTPVTTTEELKELGKGIRRDGYSDQAVERLTELAVQWVLANPTPEPIPPPNYRR